MKCIAEAVHGKPFCLRNYEDSSKGMESHGGLANVMNIFQNYNAYIGTVISDDNSSCCSILQHSYKLQKEMAEEKGCMFEWPTYKDRKTKKQSIGILPKEHPPITFLADVNHQLQAMFGKIFTLSRKKFGISCYRHGCPPLETQFHDGHFCKPR